MLGNSLNIFICKQTSSIYNTDIYKQNGIMTKAEAYKVILHTQISGLSQLEFKSHQCLHYFLEQDVCYSFF